MQRQFSLEAQEEMLSVRVHAPDPTAGEALGPALEAMPRLRGGDLVRDPVEQHRPNPAGRVVDRVALGHASDGPTRSA